MTLTRIGRRDVATLAPTSTAADAARLMAEARVGSVLVVEGGLPVGIVTDRDLALRVLLPGRRGRETPLRDVMSGDLVTATEGLPCDEAAWRMREHRVRRLPIVDDGGALVGIVTLDDLLGKVASLRGDVAELLAAFHAPNQQV